MANPRVFLAGRVCVESDGRILDEAALPGPQGRLVFALLAAEHRRSVSRDELAAELWPDAAPRAWEAALRAVVSKVRASLAGVGLGGNALASAFGAYQLGLPGGTWVDLEAAAGAIHRAEGAIRAERREEAGGWALAARAVAERPFLPGAEGPWATATRHRLHEVRVRVLEVLSQVWRDREPALAARDAEEVLRLEPFRESGYRLLMRAHVAAGNRAEALRAYERCRRLFAEELGVDPSPETEAVFREALGSG